MIKVSIIITTYNAEKTIGRTLESVFNQEGLGDEFICEVLVIDDNSRDTTTEIIRSFNVDHLIINNPNSGGPNKGRNIGLRMATGDYICFLDHDDIWLPSKIHHQLLAAQLAPIVTCGYKTINTETGAQWESNGEDFKNKVYQKNETFLKKLSKEKYNIQQTYFSTIMIAKTLQDVFFEEHFGMIDFDWLLRLFHQQASVEVNANLVQRYVGTKNLSLDNEYRKKDYYYSLLSLESFENTYSHQVAVSRRRINGSRARYFYSVGDMRAARKYFRRSQWGAKEVMYYITTYVGSEWVKKHFHVFG